MTLFEMSATYQAGADALRRRIRLLRSEVRSQTDADTVRALKEIGYDGDFSYESGSQRIPPETREDWLKYTVELGRKLMAIE